MRNALQLQQQNQLPDTRMTTTTLPSDEVINTELSTTFAKTAIQDEGLEQGSAELGEGLVTSDFNEDEPLALPNGYDVVATRETLLSVAPFVNQGNRSFWRKMIDTPEFVGTLVSSYHHILDSISDGGVIMEERLNDIENSPLIDDITGHFANMYFGLSRLARDAFLPRLPEILLFMILNALQAAAPKHQRMYTSIEFRGLILDWATELFGGVRSSNVQNMRDWIFEDCNHQPLMKQRFENIHTIRMDKTLGNAKKKAAYDIRTLNSRFNLEHSPLIRMYINRNNKGARQVKSKVTVTLSHFPERPLLTLQEGLIKTVRCQERNTDEVRIKKIMKKAMHTRKTVLRDAQLAQKSYARDMRRIRDSLTIRLKQLKGIATSKKEDNDAKMAMQLAGVQT